MEIMELSEKKQKEYAKAVKKEKFKKRLTLMKARLLKQKLPKYDSRTIQAHSDVNGNLTEYYISNVYLQDESSYCSVSKVKEDFENKRFVYLGIVGGANNALGIIESNVSIDEIVASPYGNEKLQEMLSKENAESVRDYYYDKIGESKELLPGHSSYFFKPVFVLGTIIKDEDNKFSYSMESSPDIDRMLAEEREKDRKVSLLREESAVHRDLGGGVVISEVDCWIDQNDGIKYVGINRDALLYKFKPGKPIRTSDGKYVYLGDLQIGERKTVVEENSRNVEFVKPFDYADIVIWTDNQTLLQYFMDKKFFGLNFSLGDLFTIDSVGKAKERDDSFIGGIKLNDDGICEYTSEVPATVRFAAQELMKASRDDHETNFYNLDELR